MFLFLFNPTPHPNYASIGGGGGIVSFVLYAFLNHIAEF